jgi:hypothetical protein
MECRYSWMRYKQRNKMDTMVAAEKAPSSNSAGNPSCHPPKPIKQLLFGGSDLSNNLKAFTRTGLK